MSRNVLGVVRRIRPAWWVLALAIATAGVWQRYRFIETARTIEQTQRRIAELTRMRDQLLADNSRLSSRERIEKFAVNDLGMIPTRRAQKRTLVIDTTTVALGQ